MKISIITPSLNSADHIERAIQSVLDQKIENFEHIIVDAVSKDGTIDILKKYSHLRWVSEPDNGQSDAMNKGFAMSSGDIIVYLNSDDYFLPNVFEKVLPFFESEKKFVVGDVLLQTMQGNEFNIKPNINYQKMLRHWEHAAFPNNPVQYFYHREVQEKFPFNINNKRTMDLEFLFDAASYYDFTKVDMTFGVYPLLDGAVSVEAQKDPMYWSFDTFGFLDRHVMNFEKKEILEFKSSQQKAYLERTLQTMNEGSIHGKYDGLISSLRELTTTSFSKNPRKKYNLYKNVLKMFYRLGG